MLPETSKRILDKLGRMIEQEVCSDASRVLFVDDGSKDATWEMIAKLHAQDPHFAAANWRTIEATRTRCLQAS